MSKSKEKIEVMYIIFKIVVLPTEIFSLFCDDILFEIYFIILLLLSDVSYNEIINVSPFNNTIDLGEIQGQHLKKILEFSTTNNSISLLQVSGRNSEISKFLFFYKKFFYKDFESFIT